MALQLDVIGILVEDLAQSLVFYRRLGLALLPELDSEPHAEVALPSGVRLAWDTEESVEKFVPDSSPRFRAASASACRRWRRCVRYGPGS